MPENIKINHQLIDFSASVQTTKAQMTAIEKLKIMSEMQI